MARWKKIFYTLSLLIIIMAIVIHIILSNITTGSEEVGLTLDCYSSMTFSFSNASSLSIDREGIYILPEEFNISRIYVSIWLKPDRDLPVRFIYYSREYVIPHVEFPNGSEIVLSDFIIHPHANITFLGAVLGGYSEYKEIYTVKNSFEHSHFPPFHSSLAQYDPIHYVSMEKLTYLIRNLINQHESFSISFYVSSTCTILTYPRELALVFDKCFLTLTFNKKNDNILLNVSFPDEKVLGTYKLTYDMKSFKWYTILQTIDLVLTILIALLTVVFVSIYLLKKEGLMKTLALLGLVLIMVGAYVDFNLNRHSNGYVIIHFYSYFTDGYKNIPPEVMWHVSNAVVEGTRLEGSLPKVISWIGFMGVDLTEADFSLTNWNDFGVMNAELSLKLASEDELLCYDHYDMGLCPVYVWSALLKNSSLHTLTLPEPNDNREVIMDADITVNFFLNRDNLKGNIILDNHNLCRFILKSEGGQILLRNFTLPNTYVMPKMDITYYEKISWANQVLGILGVFLILSSLALWLNRGGKHTLKTYILRVKGSKTTENKIL